MLLLALLSAGTAGAATEGALLVGTYDSMVQDPMFDGLRVGGRVAWGAWDLTLTGSAAPRRVPDDGLPLVLAMVTSRDGQAGLTTAWSDDWGLSAVGGWGAPVPEDPCALAGGPRLLAGLGMQQRTHFWMALDPEDPALITPDHEQTFAGLGPVVGAAFDARLGSPVGLRLSVLDHMWVPVGDTATLDDVALLHQVTFALDASWSFR